MDLANFIPAFVMFPYPNETTSRSRRPYVPYQLLSPENRFLELCFMLLPFTAESHRSLSHLNLASRLI